MLVRYTREVMVAAVLLLMLAAMAACSSEPELGAPQAPTAAPRPGCARPTCAYPACGARATFRVCNEAVGRATRNDH